MSLKKIAEAAGTSVSTVSKVLSGNYGSCASQELQDKIWQAAHELHYIPNQNAQNLKKGISPQEEPRKVSIVLSRVDSLETDLFFKDLYRHLEISILKKGFTLDQIINAAQLKKEDCQALSGIIVLGRCSKERLKLMKSYTQNIVGIWRNPMDFEIDEVVCDGQKAAEMAVQYLIRLGHRQIGYIGDCSYESRYIGYTQTMIQEKLSLNYDHIISTDQTKEEGARAMEQLLRLDNLTAVLCANDMSALGALEVLHSQPRRNQKKISIISIDDIEEAQDTVPLLTTIRIPRGDMAHMAVEILADRINHGHTQNLRMEFPCRIIERDSCRRCDT